MATTINAYSVGLTLDASSYIRNSELSRKETSSLIRIINSSRQPADRYARAINTIERAHESGAIDAKTYNTLINRQEASLRQATMATKGHGAAISLLSTRFLSIAAVVRTVSRSITLNAELEAASASFKIFTGSAEGAKQMLGELRQVASTTPLTFRSVTDAATTMMSFNVATKDVLPSIRMLGEITGGNTERFKNLTLAFAQSQSAGRLLGQDLRQMVDAGFNPLQEMALRTGKSFAQLKEEQEKGLITSQMVVDAFRSATSEGGRFHGRLQEIAGTSAGSLAIAQSKLEMMGTDLGEKLVPLTVRVLETFVEWGPAIEDATANIGVMVEGLASIADGIKFLKGETSDAFRPGAVGLAAPLTNLRRVRDTLKTLLVGTRDDVKKMAIEIQETYGSAIFPPAFNNLIAAHKRAAELNEQISKRMKEIDERGAQESAQQSKEDAEQQEKTRKSIEKQIANLENQLRIKRLGSAEGAKQNAIAEGADKLQAERIFMLQKELDLRKKQEASQKELARLEARVNTQKKRQAEATRRDAERLNDSVLTSTEKAAKKLREIERLREARAITAFEAERARQRTLLDIAQKIKGPETIEVGSAEDVKLLAELQNRAQFERATRNTLNRLGQQAVGKQVDERAEELRLLNQQVADSKKALEVANKQLAELRSLNENQPVRVR